MPNIVFPVLGQDVRYVALESKLIQKFGRRNYRLPKFKQTFYIVFSKINTNNQVKVKSPVASLHFTHLAGVSVLFCKKKLKDLLPASASAP
jgi:hypothetical protein